MSVRGPNATASVRGTSFEFDTKNLTVQSGVVAFRGNKGIEMLIPSGSSSTVATNETAVDPIRTDTLSLVPKTTVSMVSSLSNNTSNDNLSDSSTNAPGNDSNNTPSDSLPNDSPNDDMMEPSIPPIDVSIELIFN
jgi:hypothetical protein